MRQLQVYPNPTPNFSKALDSSRKSGTYPSEDGYCGSYSVPTLIFLHKYTSTPASYLVFFSQFSTCAYAYRIRNTTSPFDFYFCLNELLSNYDIVCFVTTNYDITFFRWLQRFYSPEAFFIFLRVQLIEVILLIFNRKLYNLIRFIQN